MMAVIILLIIWISTANGMQQAIPAEEAANALIHETSSNLYEELFLQAHGLLFQTALKYKDNANARIQGLENYEQSLANYIKQNKEIIENKESCPSTCACSQEQLINTLHDQLKEHTELIEVQLALYLENIAQLNKKIIFHTKLLKQIHEKTALNQSGVP